MTDVTPPGVADATRFLPDQAHGPCGQLLRQDGTVVAWGAIATCAGPYAGVDLWNEDALRDDAPPALGHGYRPAQPPEPAGPDTWPPPCDLPAPWPIPVPGGDQLDLYDTERSST